MERPKNLRADVRPRDANQFGKHIVDLAVGAADRENAYRTIPVELNVLKAARDSGDFFPVYFGDCQVALATGRGSAWEQEAAKVWRPAFCMHVA